MAVQRTSPTGSNIRPLLDILTIGQSPRPDLADEVKAAAPGLAFRIKGVLDSLSLDEIEALHPLSASDTIVTLLSSGTLVRVSKEAVTCRLDTLIARRTRPVLIACTGSFPGLPAAPDVVLPSDAVNDEIVRRRPRHRLGLFVPLAEQATALAAHRSRPGLAVTTVVLPPDADPIRTRAAAEEMAAFAPDLAVLDCVSHGRRHEAIVAPVLSCAVLLSIAVAAHAAERVLVRG